MKNINNYEAKKYSKTRKYEMVEEGIYKIKKKDKLFRAHLFVTSLSFEQEPTDDFEENKMIPGVMAQYPIEDILDKYHCWVEDFYDKLNKKTFPIFHIEFASSDIENIKELREIIGKHVYNKVNEDDSVELIIE